MDPTDTSAKILRNRFKEYQSKAREHRRNQQPQQAAKAYRNAAEALETLADLKDVDREDDIEALKTRAEKLEAGEALPSGPNREFSPTGDSSNGHHSQTDDTDEFRSVAESFICSTDATWDDIGGLEDVVQTVKRSVAFGAVQDTPAGLDDTKGILLHGPPGTGKTLIAMAVAGSLDVTFFEVKTGNLLSKYFGESSKQISALFDVAREMSPSVIFLDEVDALTTARGDDTNGAARRVLDTLLSELDGLDSNDDSFVMPLASTNTPWDLDRAIRRRFEFRIYVTLPQRAAAEEIVTIHTIDGGVGFTDAPPAAFYPADASTMEFESIPDAIGTACVEHGFSGHDIEVLCKEAIQSVTFRANADIETLVADGDLAALQSYELDVPALSPSDISEAFETVSASLSSEELDRFEEWHDEYGTSI